MMVEKETSIAEKQKEIVGDFAVFQDWNDKYEHIIHLGKSLKSLDDQYKTDQNLIRGCQSRVWLHADLKDGKVYYSADSDAIITKGLISLIVAVFSGQKPEDILAADLQFIDEIGLREHLSPGRSNGLLSMVKQIKFYALALQGKK